MSIVKRQFANPKRKVIISLNAPEGSNENLISTAQDYAARLKKPVEKIVGEMRDKRRPEIVKVFDRHFGSVVDLVID